MDIPESILRLRTSLQITQAQLAAAAGLSLRSLARYEAGRNPAPKELLKLADYARAQNEPFIATILDGLLHGEIISRAEQRKSKSIPFTELAAWEAEIEKVKTLTLEPVVVIVQRIEEQLAADTSTVRVDLDAIRQLAKMGLEAAEDLQRQMKLYSTGPAPIKRKPGKKS